MQVGFLTYFPDRLGNWAIRQQTNWWSVNSRSGGPGQLVD